MRNLKELAQEALDVQNACNLSGVVHSFSRAITNLREVLPNAGTDEINGHPICKLWSDKIAHLAGTQNATMTEMSHAYQEVERIAESK